MRTSGSSKVRMLGETSQTSSTLSMFSSIDFLAAEPDHRTGLGACAVVAGITLVLVYVIAQLVWMFTASPTIVTESVLEKGLVDVPLCAGCAVRAEDVRAVDCFVVEHGASAVLTTNILEGAIPTWDPAGAVRGDAWVVLWQCSVVRDRVPFVPLVTATIVLNASHTFLSRPVFVTLPQLESGPGDTATYVADGHDRRTDVRNVPFVMVAAALEQFNGREQAAYLGRYNDFDEDAAPSVTEDILANLGLVDLEAPAPAATLWQIIPLGERDDAKCTQVMLPLVAEAWGVSSAAVATGASARTTLPMPPPTLVPTPPGSPVPTIPVYAPPITCATMSYLLAGHRIESRMLPSRPRLDVIALTFGLASGVAMGCRCCNFGRKGASSCLRDSCGKADYADGHGDAGDDGMGAYVPAHLRGSRTSSTIGMSALDVSRTPSTGPLSDTDVDDGGVSGRCTPPPIFAATGSTTPVQEFCDGDEAAEKGEVAAEVEAEAEAEVGADPLDPHPTIVQRRAEVVGVSPAARSHSGSWRGGDLQPAGPVRRTSFTSDLSRVESATTNATDN